jgi:hypothetical protein
MKANNTILGKMINVNKELFLFAEGWSPLPLLLEVCINFEKLRVRSK